MLLYFVLSNSGWPKLKGQYLCFISIRENKRRVHIRFFAFVVNIYLFVV